jgi:hypothetical protein
VARYREIERQLGPLLEALLAGRPYRRGRVPAAPAFAGVYLFSEDENHRYVGRTRNANRRLGEHTRPSSPQNSAPFAFNIARRDAAAAGLEIGGPRTLVAAHADFEPYFIAGTAGDGCTGVRRADSVGVARLSSRRLARRAGRSADSRVRTGRGPVVGAAGLTVFGRG